MMSMSEPKKRRQVNTPDETKMSEWQRQMLAEDREYLAKVRDEDGEKFGTK